MEVQREDIHISVSTSDAREKLENNQYDLLILDLLIPNWPEDEPHVKNSEDLLNELNCSDELNKPFKIIGITADKTDLITPLNTLSFKLGRLFNMKTPAPIA